VTLIYLLIDDVVLYTVILYCSIWCHSCYNMWLDILLFLFILIFDVTSYDLPWYYILYYGIWYEYINWDDIILNDIILCCYINVYDIILYSV